MTGSFERTHPLDQSAYASLQCPPGYVEISAVCTDQRFGGQGLAGRLVRAVAAGIRQRDEIPFLHTGVDNANAIRLYEALGFRLRRETRFTIGLAPAR